MRMRNVLFPGLFLFGLLSFGDLLLTWGLLRFTDGQVYEGNPLARWWFTHYGWQGLTTFKIGATLLVGALCVVISFYRPRMGRNILVFACAALTVVVLYSSALAGYLNAPCLHRRTDWQSVSEPESLPMAKERKQRLDQALRHSQDYLGLMAQLRKELIAQRLRLTEAVEIIARLEEAKSTVRLQALRLYYPGCSDKECLAANLVEYTVGTLRDDPAAAEEVFQRLDQEFRSCFSSPIPCKYSGKRASEVAGKQ
jgi:hypothetical protein